MKPVIIIAIAFVLLIPVPIFAQEYLVFFQTDNDSYNEGDIITVSGNVRGIAGTVDEPVTIKIFYDDKERFKRFIVEEVIVAQDGSFTKIFNPTMEDKSWREGKYRLEVSIGNYKEEIWFHFNISGSLRNECPKDFPVLQSDGLCIDLPEPKPGAAEKYVGMRWHQNELYDYSFDIPTNWALDEKYVSADGTTIGTRLWPEQFYPPPADIKIVFENLLESDVPELNSDAIENYLRDSVLTIPGVRIIDSYSQNELWGWTATVEIRYVQSNNEPHEIRKAFVFEDRETYFVNFAAANEERFDEYYPVYQRVLENLVIKSVTVPEFHEIALLILVASIVFVVLMSKKFKIMNDSRLISK